MFVSCKPWQFEKKGRTIVFYDSGILFFVELVAVQDSPAEPPPP